MDWFKCGVQILCVQMLLLCHVCLTQKCELSFHTEAESLMLLAGRKGSLVCDATCFVNDGVVSVVWTDKQGKRVQGRDQRLTKVTHKRGLVSELIILNATSDVSGTYTCTVSYGRQLVQSRSKSVIVFEKVPPPSKIYPQYPMGPRRGDQLILEDIDNRPVRSAELPRGSQAGNSENDIESVSPAVRDHDLEWVRPNADDGDLDKMDDGDLDKMDDDDTQADRDYAAFELLEALAWKKNLEKMASEVPLPHAARHVILQEPRGESISRRPVNHELPPSFQTRRSQEQVPTRGKENVAGSVDPIFAFSRLRRRRQADTANVMNESTTAATTKITKEDGNESPTKTTTPTPTTVTKTTTGTPTTVTKTTTGTPILSSATATSTIDVINTTSTAPVTTPRETSSPPDEGNKGGDDLAGEDNTNCPTSPEPTNFGKYGILAFAVSLSLAFLLLYAILMILFMPRILARRNARKKSDLEAPIYRKKHSDGGEIPPMPINLNDTTPSEIDLGDINQMKDLNSSLTSQSANDEGIKKEDTGPAVSTFLLRQASVNKKENESDHAKESLADHDKKTENIPHTQTDLFPSDKPEAAGKAIPEGESLLNNILTDIVSSRSETKDATETKGDNDDVKSKIRQSDFDLPPFPDPVGSDVDKDIVDV